jgi:hypothetical protein
MEFTFGIITDGNNDSFIEKIITSIENNKLKLYEIIIVGNSKVKTLNQFTKIIPFDESIKNAWITRKKNIIIEEAKYENIVMMHDYIILESDWYEGFLKFGNNWDIVVNKIKNSDGKRFRDFVLAPDLYIWRILGMRPNKGLIPYNVKANLSLNKFRYISGSYYVIKKKIGLNYKLNEKLSWGQGEDYEFCSRLIQSNILMNFNPNSTVSFLKYKTPAPWEEECPIEFIKYLTSLNF